MKKKYLQSYAITATFKNNKEAENFHNEFTFSPTTHAALEVYDNVVKIDNVNTGESIEDDLLYTKNLIEKLGGTFTENLVEL